MKDLEMPKAYDPQEVEDDIYKTWLEQGSFEPNEDAEGEPFSIVLPPPNVTGTLHMGHAAMLAIEDAMVRFARMQGRPTLWIPGTDHAAIATQSKVESILFKEEGKTRHDLGREDFLAKVRQFAQDSHDTIATQVRKMGSSVDWSREAYTLDEKRHEAVNAAFKRMFEDGLIYRGYRIVNWDPVGNTAVSDDEVVYKEGKAKLYTFNYGPECPIVISTTRPETKIGDTAIAVHPEGKWKEYIGQEFEIADFAGVSLKLKVVGDEAVEADFGTGALGVTPAHSAVDFEIAERHDLEMIQVIGEDGRIVADRGLASGMTTLEARTAVAEWIEKAGLMQEVEEIDQNLSTAERSGGVIEPLPKDQWFVNVNKEFAFSQSDYAPIEGLEDGQMVTLKGLMKHAVESGQIEILPDRFKKIYYHWIDNLRDWNISRQIWFGHRIPVWYRGDSSVEPQNDKDIHVGSEPEGEGWTQDEDTLDTWFSSGLWTFSTLGWPNEEEFNRNRKYHPTAVLETGYDIIFFWVARMILMTTYLLGEVPFKTVYLHGLVRDGEGKKMSKSLGNIIDPLDMISAYGADATRLSLLIGGTPGNDMKLSEEKIEGFRNFTNKLWNISRFVFMSVDEIRSVEEVQPKTLADKWILARLSEVVQKVTQAQAEYNLSLAGEELRDFTWNEFASWYIEIAKVQKGRDGEDGTTDAVLLYVLEAILKLWHPFMPFVTEEIYKQFENGLIISADWPKVEVREVPTEFATLQEIVTGIRNIRAELKVEPAKKVEAFASELSDEISLEKDAIEALARLSELKIGSVEGQNSSFIVGEMTVSLPLEGMVDLAEEKSKKEKELAELEARKAQLEGRLGNESYVNNAPEKLVQETKADLEAVNGMIEKIKEAIEAL